MSAVSPYLIVGVDPGLTGAIALYDFKTKTALAIYDMPVITRTTSALKGKVDAGEISRFLIPFRQSIALAMVEQVGAAPHQGRSSIFSFGFSAGIVSGVMGALQIPTFYVKPAVWKLSYGLSHDKDLSRTLATRLFPKSADQFVRKKDDGRAEALLLAKAGEGLVKK